MLRLQTKFNLISPETGEIIYFSHDCAGLHYVWVPVKKKEKKKAKKHLILTDSGKFTHSQTKQM